MKEREEILHLAIHHRSFFNLHARGSVRHGSFKVCRHSTKPRPWRQAKETRYGINLTQALGEETNTVGKTWKIGVSSFAL